MDRSFGNETHSLRRREVEEDHDKATTEVAGRCVNMASEPRRCTT